MGRLVLISGGNGSGKSDFAEKLIGGTTGDRRYIATMIPQTEENSIRIKAHKKRREKYGFITHELPYQIAEADVEPGSVVLLEDVSNLLANNIFEKGEDADAVFEDICALKERCRLLVAVTISGLESDEYEGETSAYVSSLNRINGKLSDIAEIVINMQEGQPVCRKGDICDIN